MNPQASKYTYLDGNNVKQHVFPTDDIAEAQYNHGHISGEIMKSDESLFHHDETRAALVHDLKSESFKHGFCEGWANMAAAEGDVIDEDDVKRITKNILAIIKTITELNH
jgi:hypothetical protein